MLRRITCSSTCVCRRLGNFCPLFLYAHRARCVRTTIVLAAAVRPVTTLFSRAVPLAPVSALLLSSYLALRARARAGRLGRRDCALCSAHSRNECVFQFWA
jgi:hypothetical protein